MIADSLARDYGVLIGAIAGLVLALAVAWVLVTKKWNKLTASFGDMKVTVDQINKAVNNVPDGEHTLVQRVAALEAGQQWEHTALHVIAGQIGVTLPPTPGRARWFQ